MTTEEKVEVMQASLEGKPIQQKDYNSDEWKDCDVPLWDWLRKDYRIKTNTTHHPYKSTEEMVEDFIERYNIRLGSVARPFIWAKEKEGESVSLITNFRYDTVQVGNIAYAYTMNDLFELFTYLDGSPCGKKGKEVYEFYQVQQGI